MVKERKKKLYQTNAAKAVIAAAVASSALAVGVISEQGNEVEANTLYYWDKYAVEIGRQ